MSNVQAFCTAIQFSIMSLEFRSNKVTLPARANISIANRMLLYPTPLILTLEAIQHFLPDEIYPISFLIYNHLSDVYATAGYIIFC